MPVILATWEAEAGRSLRPGVRDQLGQQSETSSLSKILKLSRCGGTHLWSQLLRRLRREDHLSPGGRGWGEPRSHYCTPAWVTRAKLCLKKKKAQGFKIDLALNLRIRYVDIDKTQPL